MSKLEWVTNTPQEYQLRVELTADDGVTILPQSEWARWRSQFVEGSPKATKRCTAEQLAKMGSVGLYRPRPPESQRAGAAPMDASALSPRGACRVRRMFTGLGGTCKLGPKYEPPHPEPAAHSRSGGPKTPSPPQGL